MIASSAIRTSILVVGSAIDKTKHLTKIGRGPNLPVATGHASRSCQAFRGNRELGQV